jgi:hypothetical protein
MRKTLLLLPMMLYVCVEAGQAQDAACDASTAMKTKGSWSQHALNTVHADPSFPKSQYPPVVSRLKAMADLFREAYPEPIGIEAVWYGSIEGNSYLDAGPLPYQFNSMYLSYFCNESTKKVERGGETGTWVHVYVNTFGGLFERFGEDWVIDGKTVTLFRAPPKVGMWKGKRLLEPTVYHERSRAVLIGRPEHVPLHYISRREFLVGVRNVWQTRLAKSPGMKDFYDKKVAVADQLLGASSEEWLKRAAIIRKNKLPDEFDGQFSTEEEGGTPVFWIASGYFHKDLPRDSPQFMVLYWRIGNSVAPRDFMTQFEANFPLEKLAAMIDH